MTNIISPGKQGSTSSYCTAFTPNCTIIPSHKLPQSYIPVNP